MAGCVATTDIGGDDGGCSTASQEEDRLRDRPVAERTVSWELDAEQRKVLDDVMLYSHSLQTVPGISPDLPIDVLLSLCDPHHDKCT